MIAKEYVVSGISTGSWTTTVLELTQYYTQTSANGSKNPYVRRQPARIQLINNGSVDLFVILQDSNYDPTNAVQLADYNYMVAQGGFRVQAGSQVVLEYELGAYAIMMKAASGTGQCYVEAMFYVKTEKVE